MRFFSSDEQQKIDELFFSAIGLKIVTFIDALKDLRYPDTRVHNLLFNFIDNMYDVFKQAGIIFDFNRGVFEVQSDDELWNGSQVVVLDSGAQYSESERAEIIAQILQILDLITIRKSAMIQTDIEHLLCDLDQTLREFLVANLLGQGELLTPRFEGFLTQGALRVVASAASFGGLSLFASQKTLKRAEKCMQNWRKTFNQLVMETKKLGHAPRVTLAEIQRLNYLINFFYDASRGEPLAQNNLIELINSSQAYCCAGDVERKTHFTDIMWNIIGLFSDLDRQSIVTLAVLVQALAAPAACNKLYKNIYAELQTAVYGYFHDHGLTKAQALKTVIEQTKIEACNLDGRINHNIKVSLSFVIGDDRSSVARVADHCGMI